MELTGRPSFTVHASCTHDCAPASRAGDGAPTACACAAEVVSHASVILSVTARTRGAIGKRDRRTNRRSRCSSSDIAGLAGRRIIGWTAENGHPMLLLIETWPARPLLAMAPGSRSE